MNKTLGAVTVVLAFGLASRAQANTITILNPGFESPTAGGSAVQSGSPTSWTLFQGAPDETGVWNINLNDYDYWNVPAPEGNQIAYLSLNRRDENPSDPTGNPATLSQILGASLVANQTYHLSGSVGHPIGFTTDGVKPTIYTVSLYAGGSLLGSTSGTGPSGTFTTFNLFFNSTVASPGLGQALEIRLSSNQAQTGFDNMELSVPDGGMTITLLGCALLGLGVLRRKLRG